MEELKPIAITLGSADLDDVLLCVQSTNGIMLDSLISGTGIAHGTRIIKINSQLNIVQLSKPTKAELLDTPLAFYSYGKRGGQLQALVVPKPPMGRKFRLED